MNYRQPEQITFRTTSRGQNLMDVIGAIPAFRTNFEGRPNKFGARIRTFTMMISDPELAQQLSNDGWGVRIYSPTNGDEPFAVLNVEINFKGDEYKDPKVVVVAPNGVQTPLNVDTVGNLDIMDNIKQFDLTINPWRNATTGTIKAYLREMVVYLEEESPVMARARSVSENTTF